MRPGEVEPNELELAVLNRIAAKDRTIAVVPARLHVLRREFTSVGSFTTFSCSASAQGRRCSLDGLIQVPGVPNGLGAVLMLKGDEPNVLEIYTFGTEY